MVFLREQNKLRSYKPSDSLNLDCHRSIVIFQNKNLGDGVLLLPFIFFVNSKFPHMHIYVCVNKALKVAFSSIGKNVTFVDVTSALDLGLFLLKKTGESTIFFDLQNSIKARFLARLCGVSHRIGWGDQSGLFLSHLVKYRPGTIRRQDERNLDLLRRIGLVPSYHDQEIDSVMRRIGPDQIFAPVQGPYLVIHPGSRWMFKTLGPSDWVEIVALIKIHLGFNIVVTGGDSLMESELGRQLEQAGAINLVGKTSIQSLIHLIANADGFLGIDTFASHLARFLRTVGVVIFGPSDFRIWGPPLESTLRVLTADPREFPCIPCNLDGCGHGKVSECLVGLSNEKIVNALAEQLKS